jgi:hypothetical protein
MDVKRTLISSKRKWPLHAAGAHLPSEFEIKKADEKSPALKSLNED